MNNNIIFTSDDKEVMRINKDGITIPDDLTANETAKAVIGILDQYVKEMVQREVAAERAACAEVCEGAVGSASMYSCPDTARFAYGIKNHCQELIRERSQA
jgi:hypothetical protein